VLNIAAYKVSEAHFSLPINRPSNVNPILENTPTTPYSSIHKLLEGY